MLNRRLVRVYDQTLQKKNSISLDIDAYYEKASTSKGRKAWIKDWFRYTLKMNTNCRRYFNFRFRYQSNLRFPSSSV
ncbi:hypothetical protein BpHYR1_020094 [Brachionus plicatilis]|uniref:Uncharacterized protein n=1 Tax=Brachionus plicatilis TaxID=10195 RepID=A0A3M7Q0H1_BRAPC|nr:hypothetical protein BpHYR1_020094 [Brachionus plicatilis]